MLLIHPGTDANPCHNLLQIIIYSNTRNHYYYHANIIFHQFDLLRKIKASLASLLISPHALLYAVRVESIAFILNLPVSNNVLTLFSFPKHEKNIASRVDSHRRLQVSLSTHFLLPTSMYETLLVMK